MPALASGTRWRSIGRASPTTRRIGRPVSRHLTASRKLLPERADFICVAERYATDVRQHEIPPLPGEPLLAENLFEPMDLAADRGVRQSELLARPDNAPPPLRDDPEVEEVVVVEPFHAASICRFSRRLTLKLPNSRMMA